jgi:hypothetical protein
MGRPREQKVRAEAAPKAARARHDAKQDAARQSYLDGPEHIWSIEQLESALIVQAFSVVEHGREAVPLFELMERHLAVMKRAEEVLERNGIRSLKDLEPHFEKARPLTRAQRDARGRARWEQGE